jgi:hypothetical protein
MARLDHVRIALLALAAVTAAPACKRSNQYYCEGAPHDNCVALDALPRPCTSSADCVPPTAVCDVEGAMTCVQCTPAEDDACGGRTPTCKENTCQACSAHSDCSSSACLPDGSCADVGQTAYVEPAPVGTDNDTCTFAAPCTVIAKAVATGRPYLKLKGTTNEQVTLNNRNVTILAEPGAKLTDTSNGILLRIDGTSQVAIYDLEISGASGLGNGFGISIPPGATAAVTLERVKVTGNQAGGISASGGTLTIARSTISGNSGGGLSLSSAQYRLTNNMIVQNGSPLSSLGGVLISQITTAGTHVFEFNTVAQNVSTAGITPGVLCSVIATPLSFTNSIVFGNGSAAQVEGNNCTWSYSDIGPMMTAGIGNTSADPMFINPTQSDFHLMSSSPAKDIADEAATLMDDFDGDPRPQGARRDMGADEIR